MENLSFEKYIENLFFSNKKISEEGFIDKIFPKNKIELYLKGNKKMCDKMIHIEYFIKKYSIFSLTNFRSHLINFYSFPKVVRYYLEDYSDDVDDDTLYHDFNDMENDIIKILKHELIYQQYIEEKYSEILNNINKMVDKNIDNDQQKIKILIKIVKNKENIKKRAINLINYTKDNFDYNDYYQSLIPYKKEFNVATIVSYGFNKKFAKQIEDLYNNYLHSADKINKNMLSLKDKIQKEINIFIKEVDKIYKFVSL